MDMRPLPKFKGPEGQEDMAYLLTPGPSTTSIGVKLAMMADWAAQDIEFRDMVLEIRGQLSRLAGCDDTFECVPLQGPGQFAIEAALGAMAPAKDGKTLVVSNGTYSDRAALVLQKLQRPYIKIEKGGRFSITAEELRPLLDADRSITHVWMAQCDRTTGIVNPVAEIAQLVKAKPRVFMVDAIASFGALPINMARDQIDVVVSSASDSLEGVPGISFVLLKRDLLVASANQSHSIALDLHGQWSGLQETGDFRFTPPTHAVVALSQALRELADEGGVVARYDRYRRNADALNDGMRRMGFSALLPRDKSGPILQTFLYPRDPAFDFEEFARLLRGRGFSIAPGVLAKQKSFRIGTIGKLDTRVIDRVLDAIEEALKVMGVDDTAPESE
jgi:2-aminoethylphosphonate-pyruvate transaminase